MVIALVCGLAQPVPGACIRHHPIWAPRGNHVKRIPRHCFRRYKLATPAAQYAEEHSVVQCKYDLCVRAANLMTAYPDSGPEDVMQAMACSGDPTTSDQEYIPSTVQAELPFIYRHMRLWSKVRGGIGLWGADPVPMRIPSCGSRIMWIPCLADPIMWIPSCASQVMWIPSCASHVWWIPCACQLDPMCIPGQVTPSRLMSCSANAFLLAYALQQQDLVRSTAGSG